MCVFGFCLFKKLPIRVQLRLFQVNLFRGLSRWLVQILDMPLAFFLALSNGIGLFKLLQIALAVQFKVVKSGLSGV